MDCETGKLLPTLLFENKNSKMDLSCKIKLLHEIFRHLNNQSLMKVPKCLKPKKIRKHDLKLWLPV